MGDLFRQLLGWISTNPEWAYLVVFSVAFAESVAVVGMIVPGVMIMIGAGALIATGDLAFWPTTGAAVIGAISGDSLSYWIGRRYRDHIRSRWPFNRYPKQLDQGVAFFQKHGAKSVVFGRFFGPVRAIIPLVAGMLQMPRWRFAASNVSSALAWAPAYLAPGIVFGASLKLAAEAAARLVILLVVFVGLIWLAAWLARRLFFLITPHVSAWVQALLGWANLHPTLGRIAQALADRDHPDAATLAGLAAALAAATAVFGVTVSAGLFGAQDLSINQIALDLGQSLHTPLGNQVMTALSRLGEPAITVPMLVAILVFLFASRQRRALEYWLAALGFILLVNPVLGWLIRTPRPDIGLNLDWPWSFPSAQVLNATVLYGFLALSLSRTLPSSWRWAPHAGAAMLVMAVASARLYFGTEWLTDILGSIALGLAWTAALGLALYRHTDEPEQGAGLTLVTVVATGVAFTATSLAQQQTDLARYTPVRSSQMISDADWRSRTAAPVARQRKDLWRRNTRPFDIQYAGGLDILATALAGQGWQAAEMLDWSNAIKLLSPSLGLNALPVVPHVHDGHHDDLTLVKDLADGRRLVLRLWATNCRVDESVPLWTGDVTELSKDNVVDLLALPLTKPARGLGNLTLRTDLERAPTISVSPGEPILLAPAGSGLLPPDAVSLPPPPSGHRAGAGLPDDREPALP